MNTKHKVIFGQKYLTPFFLILVLQVFYACVSGLNFKSDSSNKELKYVNRFNEEISKDKYEELLQLPKTTPSKVNRNTYKITQYGEVGRVDQKSMNMIYRYLDLATQQFTNREIPIVISYYPGKDSCNSTGLSFNKAPVRDRIKDLFLENKEDALIFHLYKNPEGLVLNNDVIQYYEDPNHFFEKTFFKRHYPCSSYVIITPNGEFVSHWGEYGLKSVVKNYNWLIYDMPLKN